VEIVESRPGFCKFASLTLIPIDLSQVELHLLSEQEKQWLDAYHQQVREALSPLVNSDARSWLVEATAPIRVIVRCRWRLRLTRPTTQKGPLPLPRRKAKSLL
jgi:citrate lyase gamma subunit